MAFVRGVAMTVVHVVDVVTVLNRFVTAILAMFVIVVVDVGVVRVRRVLFVGVAHREGSSLGCMGDGAGHDMRQPRERRPQWRRRSMSNSVTVSEMRRDGRQPRRLEKNKNTAGPPLSSGGAIGRRR